jgi:hypothetical protein
MREALSPSMSAAMLPAMLDRQAKASGGSPVVTVPSSLQFNGINQALFLASNIAMATATPRTFAMWVKPGTLVSNACLFGSGDTSSRIYEGTSSYNYQLKFNNANQTNGTKIGNLVSGTWTHLVMQGLSSGSQHYSYCYVNAVVGPYGYTIGTGVGGIQAIGGAGGDSASLYRPASMKGCEAGMWDGLLTQADITALYNGGTFVDPSTLTLSVAMSHYWKCGVGDSSGTIKDRIGSADFTMSNMDFTNFVADHP